MFVLWSENSCANLWYFIPLYNAILFFEIIQILKNGKSHVDSNFRYFDGQHWQYPKWGAGENTRQPWPPRSRLAVGWADLSSVELNLWGYSEEEEGCRGKGDLDNVLDEVLEQIFTNRDLTYRDLVRAGQTCQHWLLFCKIIKQIEFFNFNIDVQTI